MKDKMNNSVLQTQLENYTDKLLPYAAAATWISALAVIFSSIPRCYIWLDLIFGAIFLLMYIFRRHMAVEVKIAVTMLVPFIIGVVSFIDGGFNSAGVTLILISNVLAVMLMPRWISLWTSGLSIAVITGLWAWFRLVGHMTELEDAIFIIQLLAIAIFLLILHVVVYMVRYFLDLSIEELEDTLQTVNELAYYDQLTGLENMDMIGKILDNNAAELGEAGYVILVKVHDLRAINTVYGDEAGDMLICTLADRLRDSIREGDRVARIDGSTMAIWFRHEEGIDITQRLVELNDKWSDEIKHEDMVLRPSFYIAYASYEDGSHRKTYEDARIAMAFAIEEKIREPLFYDRQHSKGFMDRKNLKEKIYEALEKKAFYVAYQPKIDISTGRTIGLEALARWKSKAGDSISPVVFIPLIEEMNKMVTFTNQILDVVFDEWNRLVEFYGQGISVSINVSPAVIMSSNFCERLKEKTKQTRIANETIILELTEEIMINDWEKVSKIQQDLKTAGFRLSLDDFGSGYASFTYLVEMAFDEIKIDKSLVWAMGSDGMEAMISAIIRMSEELNIDLIAEGVETEEQKLVLEALGCRYMQGYLFARPEPLK